mmetsp:Transcript_11583/g.35694  ORF Transcript_11583/g.35694 Transcript_11583/m.35694 type:complete len:220 (+) Transcript_11583:19-678(+)
MLVRFDKRGGAWGKGACSSLPLGVALDVGHELRVGELPAREVRVILDEMPEEDGLLLRVALAAYVEGEERRPRRAELSDDGPRFPQRRLRLARVRLERQLAPLVRVEQRVAERRVRRRADPHEQRQRIVEEVDALRRDRLGREIQRRRERKGRAVRGGRGPRRQRVQPKQTGVHERPRLRGRHAVEPLQRERPLVRAHVRASSEGGGLEQDHGVERQQL